MNISIFIHCFVIGVCASIIAVVINVILPHENIVNWWFKIGNKAGMRIVDGREHERWFYRPIWGCEKCLAGQIGCWSFVAFKFHDYNLYFHILTVCISIMGAVILSSFINRITQ